MKRAVFGVLAILACVAATQDGPPNLPPGVYPNCGSVVGGTIGFSYPCSTGSSLITNLVAYWKLDELSGTRTKTAGTCSSCDLTAVNAPDTSSGAGTYALNLDGSSQYLSISSNSTLQVSGEFGVCAWLRPISVGAGTGPVVNKDSSAANREYSLYRSTAAVGFLVGDGTTGAPQSITTGTMTVNTRNFACGWWQSSDSKVRVSLNNGAAATSAGTITPGTASNSLYIGYDGTNYQGGVIGPVYFWKGAYPSSSQITSVYNSGSGKRCADLSSTDKTNMTSCWELSEASGSRADSIGTNTLSATNSPVATAGLVANSLGLGGYFVASSSQGLTVADNADLSNAGGNFTIIAWVNRVGAGGVYAAIATKDDVGGGNREWQFDLNNSNTLYFEVAGSGAFSGATVLTANTWYFTGGRYDVSGSPRQELILNTGITSGGSSGVVPDLAAPFRVGLRGDGNLPWNGSIDSVGFWKRKLTNSELTALYNSGAGVEYPWSAIVDLFEPSVRWADIPVYWKQRIIYVKTGVYVPEFMFPRKIR